MSKPIFSDLEKAIREVLSNATDEGEGVHSVLTERLKVLQAEYNIHFVEPDEAQLAEIE
jgi:hypothetical protein